MQPTEPDTSVFDALTCQDSPRLAWCLASDEGRQGMLQVACVVRLRLARLLYCHHDALRLSAYSLATRCVRAARDWRYQRIPW